MQKTMAIGNIGNALELRQTSGGSVLNFSIAVNEKFKKKTGEQVERTEWINCTCFGKSAELINQYCQKGSKLYIEGKMQTDSYEKDGQKHYSTKVIVNQFQFLDSKQQQNGYGQGQQQTPQHDSGFGEAPAGFDNQQQGEW